MLIDDYPMTPMRVSNALFLRWCRFYDDPELRAYYEIGMDAYDEVVDESKRLESGEGEAKETIRGDGHHVLREVRDNIQPLFCPQIETQVHNE